ncbi:uncharacterized protein si:ch211-165i18.2 [Colossoma macropomum]|uniref:uncharacterized protein si:ch211-165i18.2 n=1 Tax=Colossoma macropomum TaxID=42526 RepID=UPI001863C1C5|nr:uncharacterized protein si:ch211-165i18.2 [Colossoma macropomum]
MTLLPLLACVLLGALSAQAKVISTFNECRRFFYKGVEPQGMDQNAVKICQKYGGSSSSHYATLYSTHHRIPLYSAYTFNPGGGSTGQSLWFIEPQVSGFNEEKMSPESKFNSDAIKRNQALNSDYSYTGYDRGHLNPQSFQRDEGRVATFTLTNAAPMDPCFNRVRWSQWERMLKNLLNIMPSTAYLVTGTVPRPDFRIPQREYSMSRDFQRVTVPSHVWTAVCFKHPFVEEESFSFGYMGPNEPDGKIELMTVPQMNVMLTNLYKNPSSVKIFTDDCFSESRKSEEVQEKVKAIREPLKLKITEGDQTSYKDMSTYFWQTEIMKAGIKTACVVKEIKGKWTEPDDLRKRDMDEGSDGVKCQQVLEKSDAAAMTAADGTRCLSGERYCKTENGFKPCCTTPCLYQEKLKGYWCSSGQAQIQCSPQYSAITVKGNNCKEDHPCGKYDEDYYWCKVPGLLTSWDYCSPPLWRSKAINGHYCRPNHACAKYGEKYYWCYTDFNNNWNYCCTHDHCLSAVDGKTCKPDHPCGYYKKSYLWCYTTDGKWDYCCKQCR